MTSEDVEEHVYHRKYTTIQVMRGPAGIVITQTSDRHPEWHNQMVLLPEEWAEIVRDFPVAAFQSPEPRSCPDGGTCHHECTVGCWRIIHTGPLSGVYAGDAWPLDVVLGNSPSDGHM